MTDPIYVRRNAEGKWESCAKEEAEGEVAPFDFGSVKNVTLPYPKPTLQLDGDSPYVQLGKTLGGIGAKQSPPPSDSRPVFFFPGHVEVTQETRDRYGDDILRKIHGLGPDAEVRINPDVKRFTKAEPGAKIVDKDIDTRAARVSNFLRAIESVCREHGLCLSHQDDQGAFEVVPFDRDMLGWLLGAEDKTNI